MVSSFSGLLSGPHEGGGPLLSSPAHNGSMPVTLEPHNPQERFLSLCTSLPQLHSPEVLPLSSPALSFPLAGLQGTWPLYFFFPKCLVTNRNIAGKALFYSEQRRDAKARACRVKDGLHFSPLFPGSLPWTSYFPSLCQFHLLYGR